MDSRMRPAALRQYEEFDPEMSWSSDEGAETLLVHLPGFKKEQLRVQLTSSRALRISGERPLEGNKWLRFMKEARVPQSCDAKEITAKFEGGILYVKQPKLISPAEPQDKPGPATEAPKPQPSQTQTQVQPQPQTQPEPEPEPEPKPEPEPEPAPAPAPALGNGEPIGSVAAPSYPPKMVQEKEEPKKEVEEVAQKAQEETMDPQADTRKDEEEKTNAVERRGHTVWVFKETKKPANLKMLVAIVVVAIALALHIAYVNIVCRRYVTQEF